MASQEQAIVQVDVGLGVADAVVRQIGHASAPADRLIQESIEVTALVFFR